MNRQQTLQALAWLQQIQARAKQEADTLKQQLAEEARAEFEEQGTAPTWRFPDVGRVSTSVSHAAVYVKDEAAFREWVAKRYPDEIVTRQEVGASWQASFLSGVETTGVLVADPATAERVPGLDIRPGGTFTGVTVTFEPTAKKVFAAVADKALRLAAVEAGPGVPVVLAELSDAPVS